MSVTFSIMQREDVPGCLAVVADAWSPQVAEMARAELMQAFTVGWPPIYYIARIDQRIVGMAGHIPSWINYGVDSLLYVATLKSHRRQGIATSLVHRCLESVDTLDGNVMLTTYVPDFYLPFGFEVLSEDIRCAGKSNVLMLRRCASQREGSPRPDRLPNRPDALNGG